MNMSQVSRFAPSSTALTHDVLGRSVCGESIRPRLILTRQQNQNLEEVVDFTKDALERVRTLKFAQMIDDYLSPWREQGLSDLEVTKLLAALVGWAATGHAVTEPPAGKNS